jgi:hypothetical protein
MAVISLVGEDYHHKAQSPSSLIEAVLYRPCSCQGREKVLLVLIPDLGTCAGEWSA